MSAGRKRGYVHRIQDNTKIVKCGRMRDSCSRTTPFDEKTTCPGCLRQMGQEAMRETKEIERKEGIEADDDK